MKRLLWMMFTAAVTPALPASAQTLFTYGPYAVDKTEFVKAYQKNRAAALNQKTGIAEYLDLYTRFKLKVQAARDMRLDTLQQLKYDLQHFRTQIEASYLNDASATEALLQEAFQRSQKDIHLLHFSVGISNKVDVADTLRAYRAIRDARERLLAGEKNYDALVDKIAEETYTIKGTDLGFITALQLPYTFENVAYSLPEGGVSPLIRTRTGWHFFKNEAERPSAGRWRVAQILLSVPPDVTGDQLKRMERVADSLAKALRQGADFATMARNYSDDKMTYLSGGELPEFGTGKYELPFEKAVFALKADGDISDPIFTGFGFHIIRRLSQEKAPQSLTEDESFTYALRQQLLQDKRMEIPRAAFVQQVLRQSGYKKAATVRDAELFRYADSVVARKEVMATPISNKTIFSFTQQVVKGADWLHFVRDYKLNTDVYKGESNAALLEKYVQTAAMEYYRNHLEQFNPDFKYQLQEFKEGNLLFEVMERNIWSKAAADTAGLLRYYEANRSRYTWAASADAILLNGADSAATGEVQQQLGASTFDWLAVAEKTAGRVQADSGRYELSQLPLPAGPIPAPGTLTPVQVNPTDLTASCAKILRVYPAGQLRSFEEARGLVINDYQNYLEEAWLETLKKKYPVTIHEAVWQTIKNNP